MRPSKIFIRATVFAFTVSLLVACTKADKKPDGVNGNFGEGGSSTFLIKDLHGVGKPKTLTNTYKANGVEMATVWRVPQVVSYRFNVCISDRATRQDAAGHRFDVEDAATGRHFEDIQATNNQGCFSWFEEIPYTYFVKRSKWVVVERNIIGRGIHSGVQKVRIALNPWTVGDNPRDKGDGVESAMFLRTGDNLLEKEYLVDSKDATAALGGEMLGDDKFYVDDVEIQNIRRTENNSGTFLRINVSMTPKVIFENYAGEPGYKELKSGDFYVIGHLVLDSTGNDLKGRKILTASGDLSKAFNDPEEIGVQGQGTVIDGKLIARIDAWTDIVQAQGNLRLVLKLIPKGIRGLGTFESIYELGALRSLSSGFKGDQIQECREGVVGKDCNIAKFLKTASNFDEVKAKGQGAFEGNTYLFDRMKLRFVQVEPGETTTQRTVAYAASMCVTDAFTGERPVGLEFTVNERDVAKDDKGMLINTFPERLSTDVSRTSTLKTHEDGCLNWDSAITHQYYFPEEFIARVATVRKATGLKREFEFHLNPWDDKFTFGFDHREFKAKYWEDQKKRNKIPSRFFMSDYSYHTVRFQYAIDSLMSLQVRKTVLMDLSPRVLRYSGIINARKMTEPLRDGIWLLKVALQKNYLDPAQRNIHIDKLTKAQSVLRLANEPKGNDALKAKYNVRNESDISTRLRKFGIDPETKEYITTQTTLIRSTDGAVIHQVELKMEDLRLMRVRSNFLLELQPVNERELQVENVLHKGFRTYIEELNAEREKKRVEMGKHAVDNGENLDVVIKEEEAKIDAKLESRKAIVNQIMDGISNKLRIGRSADIDLAPFALKPEDLGPLTAQMDELKLRLEQNDFTTLDLPSCDQIDCNRFVETAKESGLEARSFVGPVIFLSNAYSDSVRATDNIPEANCSGKIEFNDEFEKKMWAKEEELFDKSTKEAGPARQNTVYNYSEYFGSLRHLCGKQVDELIKREKENQYIYYKNIPAISSAYNYAVSNNLKFMSLTDEKLRKVVFSPEELQRCHMDLPTCMLQPEAETNENSIALSNALSWLTQDVDFSRPGIVNPRRWTLKGEGVKLDPWNAEDLRTALFTRRNDDEHRYATCTLLVHSMLEDIKAAGNSEEDMARFFRDARRGCIEAQVSPILADRKIRVFKTGQDGDNYLFLGGYQLNVNVGQSFSVSRSQSYSSSWGLDAGDIIGGWFGWSGVGKFASNVFKPLSIKAVSGSNSASTSDGTSVSDSTYLVAQIAKFRVRLDEYENCVAIRFRPHFTANLSLQFHVPNYTAPAAYSKIVLANKPIFVCEGIVQRPTVDQPKFVDEHYFYFTQHFTEGDMLDQADLYNHPWLLALRGVRDFDVFMRTVRNQEDVNFMTPLTDWIYGEPPRTIDWPLAQMHETYRAIVPSFPGYYTDLDESEQLTRFPLENLLTDKDPDIGNEVTSKDRKATIEENKPSDEPPATLR